MQFIVQLTHLGSDMQPRREVFQWDIVWRLSWLPLSVRTIYATIVAEPIGSAISRPMWLRQQVHGFSLLVAQHFPRHNCAAVGDVRPAFLCKAQQRRCAYHFANTIITIGVTLTAFAKGVATAGVAS
jgi:hypothetical protein